MKFQNWENLVILLWFGFKVNPVSTLALTHRNTLDSVLWNRAKTSIEVAASYSEYSSEYSPSPILLDAEERKIETIRLAKTNNYVEGIEQIHSLLDMAKTTNGSSRYELAGIIDDTIGSFCRLAFAKPYRGRKAIRRVDAGLEALDLQLQSEVLLSPYNQVERDIMLRALRTLTAVISYGKDETAISFSNNVSTMTIFRIFQRLLSGVGVRNITGNKALSEKDFNFVLNALANTGRMDIARKVLRLQERTAFSSRLSPATYSILLKGYGKNRDLEGVRMTVQKAKEKNIRVDVIMLNSILNAFINCNECMEAEAIFNDSVAMKEKLAPNIRTYNTLLKGFAQMGALDKAKELTEVMKREQQWDAITTNTLVNAAINAMNFEYAENLLELHTKHDTNYEYGTTRNKDHPNVEAYTALIDGYAKNGNLERAFVIFKRMREIHVQPNEYTYTCLISAYAIEKNMEQALRILDHMEGSRIKPTSVTYNALFSALLRIGQYEQTFEDGYEYDRIDHQSSRHIDQALKLFQRMVKKGVRPTVKTISILLSCLATSSKPTISEATGIVSKLETDNIIPKNHLRVNTAMIRVFGATCDLEGALAVFRRIKEPDVMAVNTFLDAACRCGQSAVAFETFDSIFEDKKSSLLPDVITFSILLSSQLRLNSSIGSLRALATYKDMKAREIVPDIPLVDMILSAFMRNERSRLRKKDIIFTLNVLKDAENLKWLPGELEQRKQIIRGMLLGKMSELSRGGESFLELNAELEDELFWKKGWNKVDSGFRLWGQDGDSISASKSTQDKNLEAGDNFMASKGWNNIDSGFRLF